MAVDGILYHRVAGDSQLFVVFCSFFAEEGGLGFFCYLSACAPTPLLPGKVAKRGKKGKTRAKREAPHKLFIAFGQVSSGAQRLLFT